MFYVEPRVLIDAVWEKQDKALIYHFILKQMITVLSKYKQEQ